jgi:hypothetical protein
MKRYYCSINEKHKLQQRHTVIDQKNYNDRNLLLRILTITYYTISSITHLRDVVICLNITTHPLNLLFWSELSCLGIWFASWKCLVWHTPSRWYFVLYNQRISSIWVCNICHLHSDCSRNFQRSSQFREKLNLHLHQRRELERVHLGCAWTLSRDCAIG